MLLTEFTAQFQELIAEYRRLSQAVKETSDDLVRREIMLQMQDNVRRQNALREQYINQGETNASQS